MAAETNTVVNSTISNDQEKFLAANLVKRAHLAMVAASLCDKVKQPTGAGLVAYFVRYNRMNVPLATLTEGDSALTNSTFTVSPYSVTLDQWGDVIAISDVAELTAKHPVMAQATELLADNAARVMDREIQILWIANTNVQYGDGSIASRPAITTSTYLTDKAIHKARVTLQDAGVRPRGGPASDHTEGGTASKIPQGQAYVALCGPQVMADIMGAGTSLGTWAATAMYANQSALYNAEMGTWLGIRFVMTNFIPKIQKLGNDTAAVVSGNAFGTDTPVVTAVDGGGSLNSSTTFFYKVTRKDLTRGFEEYISIAHSTASTATGNNESFTFNFSSLTAGFVYNLYFDSVATGGTASDATLKLHTANIAVGTTTTVTAVATGVNPPTAYTQGSNAATVHFVYLLGAEACQWVGLQDLKMYVTLAQPTTDNPLLLRRKVGYKFLGKAIVADSTRLLRIEVASQF